MPKSCTFHVFISEKCEKKSHFCEIKCDFEKFHWKGRSFVGRWGDGGGGFGGEGGWLLLLSAVQQRRGTVYVEKILVQQQLHPPHGAFHELGFELALPNNNHLPTVVPQHLTVAEVALLVATDFVDLKTAVGFGNFTTRGIIICTLHIVN